MKLSRFPDSLVLIFAMIVCAQILTYFLPSGTYDIAQHEEAAAAPEQVILP